MIALSQRRGTIPAGGYWDATHEAASAVAFLAAAGIAIAPSRRRIVVAVIAEPRATRGPAQAELLDQAHGGGMMATTSDRLAHQTVMQLSFQRRCATCGHQADANPCPRCGAAAGPPTLADTWNRAHPGDPMLAVAQARTRLHRTAARSQSRRVSGRSRQRAWLPLVIVSSVAGILLGLAVWATGVFGFGSTTSSRPTSAALDSRSLSRSRSTAPSGEPRPKPPAATASLGAHRVFAGRAFSVAYPRGWTLKGAEAPAPWGTDTTIIAPRDLHTLLRIDVTTSPATSDPIAAAEPVISSVAREPGYRELGLTTGTFDGRPAARWEFLVAEAGVLLHKEDVFFTSRSGIGIAALTSAPADAYTSLAKRFTAMLRSLVAR